MLFVKSESNSAFVDCVCVGESRPRNAYTGGSFMFSQDLLSQDNENVTFFFLSVHSDLPYKPVLLR